MQKLVRGLAVAALIILGIWVWRILFPSPEHVIRKLVGDLAETVSFDSKDGNISKAYKVSKLQDFFTVDVEIAVDVPGYPPHTFTGRDEITQALMAGQQRFRGLKVEFPDVNVKVSADKESAVVNLTAQANIAGDRDFGIMEFNFLLKKIEGKWKIYRIETVKTLSWRAPEIHERIAA
ncbi:MAG TPA: hypothetical protein VFW05_06885 [Verrucomicrobiae bacterium]|jgi:hypothetical protein|nr:hypothetical protein [Verrucomicrobiae bacterium]